MTFSLITEKQKTLYNKTVSHIMQSWEWGDARKSLGLPVLRYGLFRNGSMVSAFQLTLHKIPLTNQFVGYLPKGPLPNNELAQALEKIGQQYHCTFIKVEPNIFSTGSPFKTYPKFLPSPKPMFTKYNFIIDLTQSEENLLANMHPKTRYNIKVAQKHKMLVEERLDDEAFEIYLKLYFDTTKRQGYHGHNQDYHRQVWATLKKAHMARLLIAFYHEPARPAGGPKTSNSLPLAAWMLLNFKDTLYYPYGGSSLEYKEAMASTLLCWEAIKLGKKLGLKKFDMWGALSPDANPNHPWQGFNRFKKGFGGELVEYIDTYDLVFNWPIYWVFTIVDKLTPVKVFLLKIMRK